MRDILKIDKKFGETLLGLQALALEKNEIEKNEAIPNAQKQILIQKLNFKVKIKKKIF